jgi:hypothetical protein
VARELTYPRRGWDVLALWPRDFARLVVLPVLVDELNRNHLRCSYELPRGSVLGRNFDPVTQLRSASDRETPQPLLGIAETEQIVRLSVDECDSDPHRGEGYGL